MPRTVVITGASAGVGRATAVAFAQRGWRVGLIARDPGRLESARREIEASGGAALALSADVADMGAVEHAAAQAFAEWGSIDVWVNCAMVTVYAPVSDMAAEEYRRVTEVTYLGQVHGTLAALKYMRRRDSGTIVQVGSALAYRSIPLQSAYCGAKFAVRGFTDALRCELIHERSRIRLSAVMLPGLNTPQFDWSRNKLPKRPQPVGPVYQPEAAAGAILRAAFEAPRELWVGRSTPQIIFGNMAAPGWLDRILAGKAWSGQQSDDPVQPRPDNLFAPAPDNVGAHGRFGGRASAKALEIKPSRLLGALGLTTAGAAAGLLAFALARRYSHKPRTSVSSGESASS